MVILGIIEVKVEAMQVVIIAEILLRFHNDRGEKRVIWAYIWFLAFK